MSRSTAAVRFDKDGFVLWGLYNGTCSLMLHKL